MVTPRLVAFAAIGYLLFFFYKYYRIERLRDKSLEWVAHRKKPPFALGRPGLLARADLVPLLAVTVVYAVTTFVNLGDTVAPQSFHGFAHGDEAVVIELLEPAPIERVFYYTGLYHGDKKRAYSLQFSYDGVAWHDGVLSDETPLESLSQDYSETFRWRNVNLASGTMGDTRFLRIGALFAPLELGEIALFTSDGRVLTAGDLIIPPEAAALFDEPDAVPERYDVMNSTHFDEIYHARTAYEHLRGIYPYERTHPPLGKHITSWGIALFGMTPFGWRFMPALFGVFMVPLVYILLKWMFDKTPVAVCGTLLFAFDFMHFVQTRISTIDVYTVFFILCMYLCIYRYITAGYDAPFKQTALWLGLTGLSFGLGVAAKWQCAYAGLGLLALYIIYLYNRAKHYRLLGRSFLPYLLQTLGFSFAAFIVVPGVAYVACYLPYAASRGTYGLEELSGGAWESMTAWLKAIWTEFFDNQGHMYKYHSNLDAPHNYAARWYMWLIDWKPILYYWNPIDAAGTRGSLWSFTNPIVTWAGLGALVACGIGVVKRRSLAALFIIIGYLSQLLPWIPISRITFPYHYFPSMLFICIGVAYLFHRMVERDKKRGTRQMVIFTVVAVFLFVLFYPSLTGIQVPTWYPTHLLRWLSHANWLM